MRRGIPPDQGPRYGRHVSTPRADLADVIAFSDAAEFETWLADHVDERRGVWLKIARKGSGVASLTGDEAVDVGLCYGWISGQRKAHDEGVLPAEVRFSAPAGEPMVPGERTQGRRTHCRRADATGRTRRGRSRQG